MALAFDVAMTRTVQFAVATMTTATATIAATANRLAAVGVYHSSNTATGITGSVAGVSGAIITNTDTGAGVTQRTFLLGVIAPTSGATKSATVSWTGNRDVYAGCAVFNGGDQTTGFSNGVTKTGTAVSPTVTPTSGNAGDMAVACEASSTAAGGTQTAVTAILSGTTDDFQMMRGNQGSAFTWNSPSGMLAVSGAVIMQASGGGGAGLPFFMQDDLKTGYFQGLKGGFQ